MPSDAFTEPYVLLWSKEPGQGGLLENVQMRQLAGRHFVVGRLANYGAPTPDPRVGRTFWFPVDDIILIMEYADLESAQRYYEHRREQAAQKEKSSDKPRGWFGK